MPETPPGVGAPAAPNALSWVLTTQLVLTAEDDPRTRPSYPALRESIREQGRNLSPIFVSKPDADGKRRVYEGNGRTCAAIDCGIEKLQGVELPRELTKVELVDFIAAHNGLRRVLTAEDWAAMAETLIASGLTQQEAAKRLHRSPGQLSKWLSAVEPPERHKAVWGQLHASIRSTINAERDPAIVDALVAFATAPRNGRLPTRDAVDLHRKSLKKQGKSNRKPKALKARHEGRAFQIELKDKDAAASMAEWLQSLAKRIAKAGDMDPQGWGFLFS